MDVTLNNLTSHSTLADLPTSDFSVSKETQGQVVAIQFERDPELPGVLIHDDGKLIGTISREAFLEHLSRPFALELYMRRPITALLKAVTIEPLVLRADCAIYKAAHIALDRPREHVYEPLIVDFGDQRVSILSIYTLLLAQSKQLEIANETVQRQKEIADAANRAKSQFLSMMSHEIRTPMNGVIGMTDLVLKTELTADQRNNLEMVKNSAEWLLSIINDVLDFSKIEAGKLEIEIINFRLRQLLDDLMGVLGFPAQEKDIDIICSIAPDVPQVVSGDPHRLRQIFVNLVGNAIKFTEHGQIEIRVERAPAAASHLHFAVRDTGIGIPESRIKTIFAGFQQADGSTTRKYGGTGLGLTISKRLVELMGGSIWCESQLGVGSTFHFLARLEPQPDDAEVVELGAGHRSSPVREMPSLRVLLVEDNAVNQVLAVKLLEEQNHRVTLVGDGKQAVDRYREQDFDVVLMDVQMPVMDGFEATGKIRQIEVQRGEARTPIIAMTAHTMKGDREKCIDAGMDGYVSKPIRIQLLHEQLAAMLPLVESKQSAKAPAADLAANNGQAESAPPPLPSGRATIDWDAALANMGGREDLLREVAAAFLAEQEGMIRSLEQAISSADPQKVQRAAHTIKGSVGYFSATAAYETAYALETMGREGRIDQAPEALQRLLAELQKLEPLLTTFHRGSRAGQASEADAVV